MTTFITAIPFAFSPLSKANNVTLVSIACITLHPTHILLVEWADLYSYTCSLSLTYKAAKFGTIRHYREAMVVLGSRSPWSNAHEKEKFKFIRQCLL